MVIKKYIAMMFGAVCCLTCCGAHIIAAERDVETPYMASLCQITSRVLDEAIVCQTLFGDAVVEKETFETNDSVNISSGDASVWLSDGNLSYQNSENAAAVDGIIFRMLSHESSENRKEDLQEWAAMEEILGDVCGFEEGEAFKLVKAEKFDSSTLQEMCRQYELDTEDIVWEDGTYTALEYEISYGGIPLMGMSEPAQGYYMDISGADPAYARILLGDEQLLSLEIQGLFAVQDYETVTIISQEEAQQIADEEMSELINGSTGSWSGMRLEYVLLPDWSDPMAVPKELVPYWCLLYEQESEDGISMRAVRINAITGGDLAYGE